MDIVQIPVSTLRLGSPKFVVFAQCFWEDQMEVTVDRTLAEAGRYYKARCLFSIGIMHCLLYTSLLVNHMPIVRQQRHRYAAVYNTCQLITRPRHPFLDPRSSDLDRLHCCPILSAAASCPRSGFFQEPLAAPS